jgi:hypothetical protein
MPRRSLGYRQLKALEDVNKLEHLTALGTIPKKPSDTLNQDIPATLPEKMVMNYLDRLKIEYAFQYRTVDNPLTAYNESEFIRDFYIPQFNIIIEVFGTYWHSIASAEKSNVDKKARALIEGYAVVEKGAPLLPSFGHVTGKFLIWWEYEIYADLAFLFARDIPELYEGYARGERRPLTFDAKQATIEKQQDSRAFSARRLKPDVDSPVAKNLRKLRKQLFDINRINPGYKDALHDLADRRTPAFVTEERKRRLRSWPKPKTYG